MLIVKCNKFEVEELFTSDDYNYIISEIDSMIIQFESEGIMLIDTTVNEHLSRIYDFASMENGWEFSIVVSHGHIKSLKSLK